MYDFLWFPIGALVGGAVSVFFIVQTAKRAAAHHAETLHHTSKADVLASMQIVDITSTNNSYDPMGTVLSELDMKDVKTILGENLRADMEGYME